jgi:hypothetical protein
MAGPIHDHADALRRRPLSLDMAFIFYMAFRSLNVFFVSSATYAGGTIFYQWQAFLDNKRK